MPIRWRLTLWFSLILLVILAFSGTVLHFLLERYLNDEVDNSLRAYSARVHGSLPLDMVGTLDYDVIHSKLPYINEFAFPVIYIQLVEKSGKAVVKSDNLGSQELPTNPQLMERGFSGREGMGTVAAGEGAKVRIMISPLYLFDQTLVLEVAQSLKPIDALLSQATWALVGSILLALVLAGTSGAVMVRRALSPVNRITRTAQRIESSFDLTRRVGYRGPMDEIGRLATTFDRMIEHLDRVFKSQRNFIADASHELRSPLTVLRGNLDLLKRDLSDEDRLESLTAMQSETERMVATVNDLLLLAEVDSGRGEKQEIVPLKDLLLESVRRSQQGAGGRKIVLGRLAELSAPGDVYRLKQLLGNLLDNAIRYTPDDGAITVSLFQAGTFACLQVTDTGIGIAPEHLPHIFDRFYRVDKARSRATGGTGLGLAIARGIAEQHGGRLTAKSQPGKGSTFQAWLKL